MTVTERTTARVWLALWTVYLVWGSTYLAIRMAVAPGTGLPPFLLGGFRFIVAGTLLFGLVRLRDRTPITFANWRAAALIGGLMLIGGNGMVCWAEQFIPSGMTALI